MTDILSAQLHTLEMCKGVQDEQKHLHTHPTIGVWGCAVQKVGRFTGCAKSGFLKTFVASPRIEVARWLAGHYLFRARKPRLAHWAEGGGAKRNRRALEPRPLHRRQNVRYEAPIFLVRAQAAFAAAVERRAAAKALSSQRGIVIPQVGLSGGAAS